MSDLQNVFQLLNLVILIGLGIGGYMAFHSGKSRTASETQDRIINAVQAENEVLTSKVVRLETEMGKLGHILKLIQEALKQRGMVITIDGDLISIHDNGNTQFGHIKGA